ncbi:hypothetical protein FOPG_19070 [Fusarium oxysporum f. sp. conglutinans race 2 54008]|uniref:Uncharacterized protein n=1 Tax=Fusarium oxysporum f. sp. conglutinans race 2 54008 TaxID=1089457 RepID=X0GXQ0_FUSOX|nr:hypothetical protein FOPG_19070 [Fusarium oxysporum f. sp. conglutinans race 2 54008]
MSPNHPRHCRTTALCPWVPSSPLPTLFLPVATRSKNPKFEIESSTRLYEMLSARFLCRAHPLLSDRNCINKTAASTPNSVAKMASSSASARVHLMTSPRDAR